MRINPDFQPPFYLRHHHLQSVLASSTLRRWQVRRRSQTLLQSSRHLLITCQHGVRLQGELALSSQQNAPMAFLIHGWEGSSSSAYMLALGSRLYDEGFSVFRLNLRDHGHSHHLNPRLFNSTRLQEVMDAALHIQKHWAPEGLYLAGFSLGGNFALRLAKDGASQGLHLRKVVSVCPVLDPIQTMRQLEQGWAAYHLYFRNKWQRSIKRKIRFYPELSHSEQLLSEKTLRGMNHYFVPYHTDYEESDSYLDAYAVTGDRLAELAVPTHILMAEDDPIIRVRDLEAVTKSAHLQIETTRYGGHCGFIENLQLTSWVDKRITQLFVEG